MTPPLPKPATNVRIYGDLFTQAQLLEAYQAGQRDMREAAAEAIDDGCRESIMTASDCIEAIRDLPLEDLK